MKRFGWEWDKKKLKCFISYNGCEYSNKKFDSYYSYYGIHIEKIVPRTPQENGVLERMMQLKKLGIIALEIELMCFLLLRSGKFWLRMGQEKDWSLSYLIMEVNTAAKSLIVIVHTMGFVERRQSLEHHKKMVCQKGWTKWSWSMQDVCDCMQGCPYSFGFML